MPVSKAPAGARRKFTSYPYVQNIPALRRQDKPVHLYFDQLYKAWKGRVWHVMSDDTGHTTLCGHSPSASGFFGASPFNPNLKVCKKCVPDTVRPIQILHRQVIK